MNKFWGFAFVFCFFLLTPALSNAQDDPRWEVQRSDVPDTCDHEFMQVLESRAWMEGKREVEHAQKLILKPDSTLEYICIAQRLGELNTPGANWSNRKDGTKMVDALNVLVRQPLVQYLGNNFSHSLGGGTFTGSTGPCDAMYKIWDFLKCDNFDKVDFERTYSSIVGTAIQGDDPRTLPEPCNDGQRATVWQKAIQRSNPPARKPGQKGGMDQLETFITNISQQCSQSRAIPTGVYIYTPSGATSHEEHVCLPPGCSWNPGDTFCH